MSLRAELVRLGLRWFVKRKIGPATTLNGWSLEMVEPKEVEAELMAAIEKLRGVIHFSPACHVFVILLAQPMHHFVGGRASGECSTWPPTTNACATHTSTRGLLD
jgi:hypothetical protein